MAEKQDLSDQAVGAAKQLAPWSTRLPWWVVLIEGLVLGVIGLLVVIDPQGANVNLVLFLSAALVIAGLMQFWNIMSSHVPEKIDSVVASRAAVAVFAGLNILVLFFIEGALTRVAGYSIFGTAALVYGLLALVQVFRTDGSSRRTGLVEFLVFTSVGAIALWGLYSGGDAIIQAVRIIGWIFLIGGIALIALSIWRWRKGDEADEAIEAATGVVSGAADAVTSLGKPADKKVAGAAPSAAETADQVEDEVAGRRIIGK